MKKCTLTSLLQYNIYITVKEYVSSLHEKQNKNKKKPNHKCVLGKTKKSILDAVIEVKGKKIWVYLGVLVLAYTE